MCRAPPDSTAIKSQRDFAFAVKDRRRPRTAAEVGEEKFDRELYRVSDLVLSALDALTRSRVMSKASATRKLLSSYLYRSLPGFGSPVSGSLAGDGDNSLK